MITQGKLHRLFQNILIPSTPTNPHLLEALSYHLAERAKTGPDLYSFHNMPTWTNPTIAPEEIEIARKTMPPRLFQQEYEASFTDYEGKIFSELGEDNLCDRLPDSFDLTIMGIDWGECNPAIVVWGLSKGVWYWCEAYQPNGDLPIPAPVMDSHVLRLATKWQVKGSYCDPSRPSAIIGIRALGKNNNHMGLVKAVAGNNRIEEGINWLHSLVFQKKMMFPRKPISEHKECVNGNDAYLKFEAYHRKTDKNGVVTGEVAPNQDDHIIDASRYALFTAK